MALKIIFIKDLPYYLISLFLPDNTYKYNLFNRYLVVRFHRKIQIQQKCCINDELNENKHMVMRYTIIISKNRKTNLGSLVNY